MSLRDKIKAYFLVILLGFWTFPSTLRGDSDPSTKKNSNRTEINPFIDPDAGPLPKDALMRVGSSRFRHQGEVTEIAFSPDGKLLASISTDLRAMTARIWDLATGRETFRTKIQAKTFHDQAREIPRFLSFSKDSKKLYVGDLVSLRCFDLKTGKATFSYRFASEEQQKRIERNDLFMCGVAVTPDEKNFIVVWSDEKFYIRSLTSGDLLLEGAYWENGNSRIPVEFSTDGKSFKLGEEAENISIYHTENVQRYQKISENYVRYKVSKILPDNRGLIALGRDNLEKENRLQTFDMKTGKVLQTIQLDKLSLYDSLATNGKLAALGNWSHGTQIFDLKSGKEIHRIQAAFDRMVFSPNEKLLAATRSGSNAIFLWDLEKKDYHPLSGEPPSYSTRFSADGKAIVLGDRVRTHLDWRTGKVIGNRGDLKSSNVPLLSPDGKIFALDDSKGTIRLLDAQSGKELRTLAGQNPRIRQIFFSADSKRLLSTCWEDRLIRVWNVQTGKQIAQFLLPEEFWLGSISLSADGTILATRLYRRPSPVDFCWIWDVDQGKVLARLEANSRFYSSVTISPNGKYLFGGCVNDERNPLLRRDTEMAIWEAKTGRKIHILPNQSGHEYPSGSSGSFSSDNRLLMTADGSGLLRLWEVATGKEIYRFKGHHNFPEGSFSPDGRLFVANSEDIPCFIWDITGVLTSKQKTPFDGEQLWKDLVKEPREAFLAIRQLVAYPKESLVLLKKNLKPTKDPTKEQVDQLFLDLDSDRFVVREKAMTELMNMVELVEARLRQLSKTSNSAEIRQRINIILEALEKPSTQRLREMRALQALEFIGTSEVLEFLAELKKGSKSFSLTKDAEESYQRVQRNLQFSQQ